MLSVLSIIGQIMHQISTWCTLYTVCTLYSVHVIEISITIQSVSRFIIKQIIINRLQRRCSSIPGRLVKVMLSAALLGQFLA